MSDIRRNDNFFQTIETDDQAYFLGWIAVAGALAKNDALTISAPTKDRDSLQTLRERVGFEASQLHLGMAHSRLTLTSPQIVADVCRWLDSKPGKKTPGAAFPDLTPEKLRWAFLRGGFDSGGSLTRITVHHSQPKCRLVSCSSRLMESISQFCGQPYRRSPTSLEWSGYNALDFLGRLYDGQSLCLPRKKNRYEEWCGWLPGRKGQKTPDPNLRFEWSRALPEAIAPSKTHTSDSGYDLTLVRQVSSHGQLFCL